MFRRAGLLVLVLTLLLITTSVRPGSTLPRESSGLVGTWQITATLADFADIFEPHHGTRRRKVKVVFEEVGGKLTGHSENPRARQINGQNDWNGRTDFTRVHFSRGNSHWNSQLSAKASKRRSSLRPC